MKKGHGGNKVSSDQKRKLENKIRIKPFFNSCKSYPSLTSENQLENKKFKNWESEYSSLENFFKITPQMIKILQLLKTVEVISYAQKILERDSQLPKTTFYRLIKKLESYGFLSFIPNIYPKMIKLHPGIIFLLSQNSEGISPEKNRRKKPKNEGDLFKLQKNDRASKSDDEVLKNFSPNKKLNPLNQNNPNRKEFHFFKNGKVGKWESNGDSSKFQKDKSDSKSQKKVPRTYPSFSKQTNENPPFKQKHFPKNAKYRENSPHSPTSPRESEGIYELDPLIIRSHNYFFKIPFQRKPAYLDRMLAKTIWFEKKNMRNWSYFQGKLSMFGCEAIIQFNPNMVTVWLNNIFGRNSHENNLEANRRILEIKGFLEDEYSGLYLAPHIFIRRVPNKGIEHGWIHHHLALKAKQQNITLKGRNWEIDSSKDMPELEANHKLASSEHLMEELEDYDFRSEKSIYFRDIHSNQEKHIELIKNIQDVQTQLAGGLMTNFQIADSVLNSNLEIIKTMKDFDLKINSIKINLQERIYNFILTHKGLTRKEIAEKLSIKIGSVNGTIVRLKKKKEIKEINSRLFPR